MILAMQQNHPAATRIAQECCYPLRRELQLLAAARLRKNAAS